jgi:hypothetical protein
MMIGGPSFYSDPPESLARPKRRREAEAASDEPLFREIEDPEPPDGVLSVEEATWKVELARPARLVLTGWMVSGEVVVGNHRGDPVQVPEVRAFPEQAFMTLDYFRMNIRGKKGTVSLLQEGEARIVVNGQPVEQTDDLDNATLEIVRRDQNLEPDFDVTLKLLRDPSLPDPRARLLSVDTSDRLVAALFTTGFPLRSDRRLRLGPVRALFRFDGALLRITDYLQSYRTPTGFHPFFVREGEGPWRTVPEDGSRVELQPGDGLMVGPAIYRYQAS